MSARKVIYCESCELRKELRKPVTADAPAYLRLDPNLWNLLRQFAAEFDQLAERKGLLFEAEEFLTWMEPSVIGTRRHTDLQRLLTVFHGPKEPAA